MLGGLLEQQADAIHAIPNDWDAALTGGRPAHGQSILGAAQMLHVRHLKWCSAGLDCLAKLMGQSRHPAIARLQWAARDEGLEHVDRRARSREVAGQNRQSLALKLSQLAALPICFPECGEGQVMSAPGQGIEEVVGASTDDGRRIGAHEQDFQPAGLDRMGSES